MSHEIYYTSAPEGLKRGTSGFCTVAASPNIPKPLWDRLETLSAYRHQFGIGAEGGGNGDRRLNPVSHAHWLLNIAGTPYHVLSRIADSGVDHTQRTNAFAHHLVLDPTELAPAGPAWMLAASNVMTTSWDGQVGPISRAAALPKADTAGGMCRAWAQLTGDAGWGGALADVFAKTPTRPVCILFAPGQEILPLMEETLALLPAALRWNVTFNTYFTSMPTSATCAWRCCLAGTPAATVGLRYASGAGGGIIIDLTDRNRLSKLLDGPYVQFARTGEPPSSLRPPPPPAPPASEKSASEKSAKAGAASTPAAPATSAARPAKPAPSILDDEEEERDFDDDSGDSIDFRPEPPPIVQSRPAVDSREIDLAPQPAPPPRRPIHRPTLKNRIVPIKPNAEAALLETETEASVAAARRRRQILILFGGAIFAIALGLVLVIISSESATPPETPPPPPPKPAPAPVVAVVKTAPPEPAPTAPAPIVVTPAPVQGSQDTSVVTGPKPSMAVPAPPPPPSEPAQIVSRYPATIQIPDALQRPVSRMGIADFRQTIPLPDSQVDPDRDVRRITLRLPRATDARRGDTVLPFTADFDGSMISSVGRRDNRPAAILSWRDSAGQTSEIVAIAYNRRPASLEFAWKTGMLVKSPEIVSLAYWLLQSSSIDTAARKEKGQSIALHPFTPPILPLSSSGTLLSWPNDLPKNTTITAPPAQSLPAGWEATWYTDWDQKDAALRTAANASQIIKFRKPTTTPGIDAWFLVKFSPDFSKVENALPTRLAEVQAELQQYESDLQAANADLEEMRKEIGGGPLPQTSDRVKNAENKQAEASKLIEAYKSALASYQEIQGFDIGIALPDGVRLATMQFRKTPK